MRAESTISTSLGLGVEVVDEVEQVAAQVDGAKVPVEAGLADVLGDAQPDRVVAAVVVPDADQVAHRRQRTNSTSR